MLKFPTIPAHKDPVKTMKALQWFGNQDVRVQDVAKPLLTDPGDAIIRTTSTTICGSDLHLYHHEFSGMERGDILGHEFMGIVEQVGSEVNNIKVGDRVVVSCIIACGQCDYCKKQLFSCCDNTNPSKEMEKLFGHRTSGIFGYSHLTGGYEGGQAEYARVPLADINCLKVPNTLPDEKVLFLSDILCTSWHANELGGVTEGQSVAVWGCGPVGLLSLMWAKYRGASKLIAIDAVPNRLQLAKEKLGAEIIDFGEKDVVQAMQQILPGGPDVCIDAVGFRFPKSLIHRLQRTLRLETDTPEVLKEAITCVKKGGKIAVVGDYYAYANQFPIGAFMEKGETMSAGQVHVQKYWKHILEILEKNEVDPTFIITHYMPLEQAAEGYKMFDEKQGGAIKIVLKPGGTGSQL